MVLLDHRREELLCHPEVGHGINLKSQSNPLLRLVHDGQTRADARIVDKDGRITVSLSDLRCSSANIGRGRDIALIEMNAGSFTQKKNMTGQPGYSVRSCRARIKPKPKTYEKGSWAGGDP